MSAIEELIDEVGSSRFRPLTESQRNHRTSAGGVLEYDADADTTISLDQAKRFSDASEGQVSSTDFDSDEVFFELWEKVVDDWSGVTVRFSGRIGVYGFLDGVYLCYGDITGGYGNTRYDFEKYCTYRFKERLDPDPQKNSGICPLCENGIDVRSHEELVRIDDNIWAHPDEFDIREYPDLGRCVRLWWDD